MIKWIYSAIKSTLLFSLIIIYFITITGCGITLPHYDLPKYSYNQIKQGQAKVSVDYDYTTDYLLQPLNHVNSENFYKIVKNVLNESNIFANFYKGTGNEPYHLSIRCRIQGPGPMSSITAGLYGLSLTLFPLYVPVDLILTVDVSKNGKVIKSYQYNDGWTSWVSTFVIVFPNNHKNPYEEVMENMIRNFLYDVQKDGIIQ